MYLPSRVQKNPAIGRLVSVVSSRAASNGSFTPFTYTLRVSLHGFWNATYFPSGESCAPAISGLPKMISRSMIGGSPAVEDFLSLPVCAASDEAASARHNKPLSIFFIRLVSSLHADDMDRT